MCYIHWKMSTLFNKLLELLAKHLGGKKSQIPISCHACMLSHFSHIRLCNLPDCSPPGSPVHRMLPTRVLKRCHFLLQGIFQTQGSNPSLLHLLCWQEGSLPTSTTLEDPSHATYKSKFSGD